MLKVLPLCEPAIEIWRNYMLPPSYRKNMTHHKKAQLPWDRCLQFCLFNLLSFIYSNNLGSFAVQSSVTLHYLILKLEQDPSLHLATLCYLAEISPCVLSDSSLLWSFFFFFFLNVTGRFLIHIRKDSEQALHFVCKNRTVGSYIEK